MGSERKTTQLITGRAWRSPQVVFLSIHFIHNVLSSYPRDDFSMFMKSRMLAFYPSLHPRHTSISHLPSRSSTATQDLDEGPIIGRHCTQSPWNIFKEASLSSRSCMSHGKDEHKLKLLFLSPKIQNGL